jgi:hypothetical protein
LCRCQIQQTIRIQDLRNKWNGTVQRLNRIKAQQNKLRFRQFQIITLVASMIIRIINVVPIGHDDVPTRTISSVIGGIIVVVIGLTQLEKYQENWILYRTSAELLKKEKYFFENSVGEYPNLSDVDKNKLLVERVESIVSAETSKYFTIHQPSKTNQKN